MTVDDVFVVRNRGVVVTGTVQTGTLQVGDTVYINGGPGITVDAIDKFRKRLGHATTGENVGVLLKDADRSQVSSGDVLTSSGEAPPIEATTFIV